MTASPVGFFSCASRKYPGQAGLFGDLVPSRICVADDCRGCYDLDRDLQKWVVRWFTDRGLGLFPFLQ